MHGMIDSDALVGFMWTKCVKHHISQIIIMLIYNVYLSLRYLSHIPLQMGFSVVMSLPTDRFAFGMRFVLDPSGLRRGD